MQSGRCGSKKRGYLVNAFLTSDVISELAEKDWEWGCDLSTVIAPTTMYNRNVLQDILRL